MKKLDKVRVVLRCVISAKIYGKIATIINAARVILLESYVTY